MNITDIKVFIVSQPGATKARVSLKVDGWLFVSGIKVVEGKNGLFLGMPNYKGKDGEYKDIVFPDSKGTRDAFTKVVLEAYEAKLEG